ncbi:MAG TPA: YkuS family protein [Clostridia bacterium]|nr:YkuS family protein [Clostridia bacterium]
MLQDRIVAVDGALENVRQALENAGFQTMKINDISLERALAIIISGMDDDFLGMSNIKTKAPVLSAKGKTAQEVVDNVKKLVH